MVGDESDSKATYSQAFHSLGLGLASPAFNEPMHYACQPT
jgi:hypothetical protein